MTLLHVCVEKFTVESQHNGTVEDPYGSWFEVLSNSVKEVRLERPENTFYDITGVMSKGEFKVGDNVYVLVCNYSTGDSFGRSTGEMEVIWAFKSFGQASLAKTICSLVKDSDVLKFKDCGETVSVYNPVFGYFEELNDFEIFQLVVK